MDKTYPGCEICTIVDTMDPEYIVIEGAHWIANVRANDQSLLGTSFITARRHVSEVDALTSEEETEFLIMRNALFQTMRKTFSPLTFNISCLKNDAFKANPDTTPPDAAHVHWHVLPRYTSAVQEFAGIAFKDPLPGQYLSVYDKYIPSHQTLVSIAEALKKNLDATI